MDREETYMAEWIECSIGDLCDTISDTYKGNDEYVVLVNTSDVLEGKVLNHETVANKNLKGQFKKTFKRDDILYSEIRPANKRFAYIDFENTSNYIASTKLMVLRHNEKVLPEYLFALLKSNYVIAELQHLAETRSGTFPQITFSSELAPMKVLLPDKDTQKRIVSILSSIEQKIDKNNEINNNLLEQASTLFNSAIQQSTSVVYAELGSLADVKGGKRLPKGVNLVTTSNQHPYIRVRDLNNTVFASLSNDYEYVDDETQQSISRYIVSTGDLLISIVGTIGLTAIVDHTLNKANLTENCVKLTNLKNVTPEYLLLFLRSSQGVEAISKGTVGAVQLKLPIKNIQSFAVPLLCDEELLPLNETLSAIFSQISVNIVEMKQLADIRDTILPKLMSGEFDVSGINL